MPIAVVASPEQQQQRLHTSFRNKEIEGKHKGKKEETKKVGCGGEETNGNIKDGKMTETMVDACSKEEGGNNASAGASAMAGTISQHQLGGRMATREARLLPIVLRHCHHHPHCWQASASWNSSGQSRSLLHIR